MKRIVLLTLTILVSYYGTLAQNVFNTSDPIVRYDPNASLGSATKPDPAKRGLQKWVSTPTNGVSTGSGA
jgi:hypothetical protein